nr:MAG TPA: hypothetical protein [Caudoviricetes sp.]
MGDHKNVRKNFNLPFVEWKSHFSLHIILMGFTIMKKKNHSSPMGNHYIFPYIK